MNYTENYHLPQWDETDRIMRTDFNQMCADIDEGIHTAQETAETLPYVVGSYIGAGEEEVVVTTGFRPSILIIFIWQDNNGLGRIAVAGDAVVSQKITFTETGFRIAPYDRQNPYPLVNYEGEACQYIAFR